MGIDCQDVADDGYSHVSRQNHGRITNRADVNILLEFRPDTVSRGGRRYENHSGAPKSWGTDVPSAAIRDALHAAFEHHQAGEFDLAENLYQTVLRDVPDELNALRRLGAMIHHAWMQDEERLFLDNPGLVFSKAHYATLAKIAAAVRLDFVGIDCALDRDDNLVVFEVNASMLIHDDNADFPYKTPHCEPIKDALQAMLTRKARPHAHAVGRANATHDRIFLFSADL